MDIDDDPELSLYNNSQKPTEGQLALKSSATIIRMKRGEMEAKFRVQESSSYREKMKADNKNKKEKAAARKVMKTMKS